MVTLKWCYCWVLSIARCGLYLDRIFSKVTRNTHGSIIVYNKKLIKMYKILHVVIALGAIVFVIRTLLLFGNVTL